MECTCGFRPKTEEHLNNHLRFFQRSGTGHAKRTGPETPRKPRFTKEQVSEPGAQA